MPVLYLIEQVIVMGNVTLTTPVIDYLLQHGIDCVFCNSLGKYHGRLTSTESRLGSLRLRQSAAVLDRDARLSLAKSFVRGKLQNCRTLLMRYRRELGLPILEETVEILEDSLKSVENCSDIGSLLGVEGSASAAYYKSFKEILKQPMGFTARVRRPPTDPVNSMLSFGYTLLTYNVQAGLSIVGFDPFIGFLHSVEQPRANLALDMVEEFRPIIVDSLVLWLVNTGVMTEAEFERPVESGRMVKITPDGLKLLQQKLNKVIKLDDSIRYYHLCAACVPKIEVKNGPPVTVAQLYFTV